jgi:hypothetical protein
MLVFAVWDWRTVIGYIYSRYRNIIEMNLQVDDDTKKISQHLRIH